MTRRNQRWTHNATVWWWNSPTPELVQGMQPLFPPTLAGAPIASKLPTVPEGVELDSQPELDESEPYDVGVEEHSGTDAPEGAQHCTRSGRPVIPPTQTNLKSSIKFKGDR
jgi:hypothetical protein